MGRALAATVGLVLAYLGIWAVAPWRELVLHCHPFFDVGLYGQACAALGTATPNPQVPALGHGIFNDHFDPVLWLTVPLRPLLGGPGAALAVEAASAVVAACAPLWLARRGVIAARTAALGTLLVLFNPGQVSAASFTLHPTTWAAAPMAWLTACLAARRPRGAVAALALLCACKEEFGFVALVLAAVLAQRGERRWAAATLTVGLTALGLAFGLRPLLWGATSVHAAKLLVGAEQGLWAFIRTRVAYPGAASRLASLAVTLAPLGLWLWRERRPVPGLLLAPVAAPLAIRFLGTAWRHHYMGCVMAGIVVALICACGRRPVARWVLALSALAAAWTTVNPTRHALRVIAGRVDACPSNPARLASIAAGARWLLAHPDGPALVSPNLVTALASRPQVFPLGPPVDGAPYRALFLEHPPHGLTWPLDYGAVAALEASWRADPTTRIIRDDAWVLLATRGSDVGRGINAR